MEMDYSKFHGIGVVLPGGGLAALESQAGALKAIFEHHGKPVDYYWGTSGGALTAGLAAAGLQSNMLPFMKSINLDKVIKHNTWVGAALFGQSLYNNRALLPILKQEMGDIPFPNTIVTITDTEAKMTIYAEADYETVFTSGCIPKVFSSYILANKIWYRRSSPQEPDQPIRTKAVYIDPQVVVSGLDGGIYRMFPVPEREVLEQLDRLYIIVPPDSPDQPNINDESTLRQALSWAIETTQREYVNVVSTYGNAPKVIILKPLPIESSLLAFSHDFKVFQHSYNYTCAVLSQKEWAAKRQITLALKQAKMMAKLEKKMIGAL